jgi:hypothetical protein
MMSHRLFRLIVIVFGIVLPIAAALYLLWFIL